ncbi:trigger factor [bacterium A37T11]|nr:trigger factor [bacterium A37T11]
MNISQENVDALNAVINIGIAPSDYSETVEKAIKEQAKKAKLPGFRPGMVPVSHIKKTHGRAILFEEINKLVNEGITNYIKEQNLEIIGQPIPKSDNGLSVNWDFDEEFNFQFEIGLAPQFNIPFTAETTFTEYEITADEETLASRIKNLRRSYGKMSNPELSEDGDILYAELNQLAEDGSVQEGGIKGTGSVRTDLVEDKKIKKSLLGLKKDEVVTINLKKAFTDEIIARILNISDELAADLGSPNFQLKVLNVNRLDEAEFNQEFFDKIYPEGEVTTEEQFRERVKNEVEGMIAQNAQQKLQNDLFTFGMENLKVEFPDDFLKKWLKATNEKLTDEELEQGYDDFVKQLKWTLLENKVISQNNLEVRYEDVFSLAKDRLAAQIKLYSPQPFTEQQLDNYTAQFLQDREQANRIVDEVKAFKVFDFLKGVVKIEKTSIPYNQFLELK